jgi:hypothetical protein
MMHVNEVLFSARAARRQRLIWQALCVASLGAIVGACRGTGTRAKPVASISETTPRTASPPSVAAPATAPTPTRTPISSAARTPGRVPFVATACDLRPGIGKKSLTFDAREQPSVEYHSRPEIRFPNEEPLCEVYNVQSAEQSSSAFGKMLMLYDGAWGKCSPLELRGRLYALGWGIRSECGSVLYEGTLSAPSSVTASDPLRLGGLETAHLIFEDHRSRSPQCEKVDARLILREEALEAGGRKISRVRYAGATTPVPAAVPLAPKPDRLPVCTLFDRPEQLADREPEPCEVGTYFLQDDGVDGKLVQLEDWAEGTCDAPRGVPIGRRLYPLGAGKRDTCGTIIYGASDAGQTWSLFGLFPNHLVFGVELRDHRFRKQSPRCPAPPALVELLEKVYAGSVDQKPVLERRFYAPQHAR